MHTVFRMGLATAVLSIFLVCPFFALALPPVAQPQADSQGNAVINFQNGRMKLKTQAVPLLPLLEKIAAVADVQIICFSKISADHLVTADLSGWPLDKTLVSLLDGNNFMVIFAPGENNRGVKVRGGVLNAGAVQSVSFSATEAEAVPDGKTSKEKRKRKGEPGPHGRSMADNAGSPAGAATEQITGSLRIEGRKYSTSMVGAALSADTGAGRPKTAALSGDTGAGRTKPQDLQRVIDKFVTKYKKPSVSVEKPGDDSARISAKIAREEYVKKQITMLTKRIESGYSDRQYEYWSKIKDPKFIQNDRDLLRSYTQELTTLYNITQ